MQLEKHILLLVWFSQLFKIVSSGFLIKDRKLYISSNEFHTWVRRKININYILFHSYKIKISVLFINNSKAIQIQRIIPIYYLELIEILLFWTNDYMNLDIWDAMNNSSVTFETYLHNQQLTINTRPNLFVENCYIRPIDTNFFQQ